MPGHGQSHLLGLQGTGEVPLTSEDIEQQEERSANAHSRMEELRAKYGDEAIEKARKEIKQGDQKRGVFHLLASFGGGVAGAFLGADAAPLFWFPVGAFGFFCGFVSVFWVVGFFVKYDD